MVLNSQIFCSTHLIAGSNSKGLFTPGKSSSDSEKDQRTIKNISKNKRQTSKKTFSFAFSFARSEHSLRNGFILNFAASPEHLNFLLCKSMPLVRRGLTSCFFLCCGVISKLTLLLVLAAPVKRKGARGEVRFSPETPLLRALFYLKGPAPCCYWLAVTCLSAVVCLSLKAVLSRLVTVL